MAATADRISNYEMEYGTEAVESFIDAVLAIQEHVDPQLIKPRHLDKQRYMEMKIREQRGEKTPKPEGQYDDLWSLDQLQVEEKAKLTACRCIISRRSRRKILCGLFRSSPRYLPIGSGTL